MTIRSYVALIAAAIVVAVATTSDAEAAESRLERVLLLRSADRLSLVLELTAEPQKVVTHTLAGTTVEVEAGPVIGPVHAQELKPPEGVPFIAHVSVHEFAAANHAVFVRARVTLLGQGRSNVRIVGRRVYVDFAAFDVPRQRPPGLASAADSRVRVARGVSWAGRSESEAVNYQQAIGPPVARLKAIGPFLISAATTPTPDALDALARTLTTMHESLRAIDVPGAAMPAHNLLTAAVVLATRAVEADFNGDRLAETHRALALVEAVKAHLPQTSAGSMP